jgi:hypothetical protein
VTRVNYLIHVNPTEAEGKERYHTEDKGGYERIRLKQISSK